MSTPSRARSGGAVARPSSASRSPSLIHRSASPTCFTTLSSAATSIRFSVGKNPRIAAASTLATAARRRVCSCSPTSHPGSFRCAMHRSLEQRGGGSGGRRIESASRLSARRSAMVNSLVRIGAVEGGELVRRSLAALIRPSSHQQRRRANFQPRRSRLSVMSVGEDACESSS